MTQDCKSEFFVSAVCEGEVLTDDEGFVASPDYPKSYSRLTDCDWTIRVCRMLFLIKDLSSEKTIASLTIFFKPAPNKEQKVSDVYDFFLEVIG